MYTLYFVLFLCCLHRQSLGGLAYYYTEPYVQQIPQSFVPLQQPSAYFAPQIASPFYQRAFLPAPQFYTPQRQFFGNYLFTPAPNAFETPKVTATVQKDKPTVDLDIRRIFTTVSPPTTKQETQSAYNQQQNEEYRGFAYRTQYNDGGFSNVVFLTGPNLQQVQNVNQRTSKNVNNITETARTIASDSIDTNSIKDESSVPPQQNFPTFGSLIQFLQNPETAFQNFYSTNNEIFSRNAFFPNYPSGTQPLPSPGLDLMSRSDFSDDGAVPATSSTAQPEIATQETSTAAGGASNDTVEITSTIMPDAIEDFSSSDGTVELASSARITATERPTSDSSVQPTENSQVTESGLETETVNVTTEKEGSSTADNNSSTISDSTEAAN